MILQDALTEMQAHFEESLVPKLEDTSIVMVLVGDHMDVKQCIEIGAAIMLDKPIIVVTEREDTKVPEILDAIALAKITGDVAADPGGAAEAIKAALTELLRDE